MCCSIIQKAFLFFTLFSVSTQTETTLPVNNCAIMCSNFEPLSGVAAPIVSLSIRPSSFATQSNKSTVKALKRQIFSLESWQKVYVKVPRECQTQWLEHCRDRCLDVVYHQEVGPKKEFIIWKRRWEYSWYKRLSCIWARLLFICMTFSSVLLSYPVSSSTSSLRVIAPPTPSTYIQRPPSALYTTQLWCTDLS
jgi:hypothetical protein